MRSNDDLGRGRVYFLGCARKFLVLASTKFSGSRGRVWNSIGFRKYFLRVGILLVKFLAKMLTKFWVFCFLLDADPRYFARFEWPLWRWKRICTRGSWFYLERPYSAFHLSMIYSRRGNLFSQKMISHVPELVLNCIINDWRLHTILCWFPKW